jgi:hypothetical protein
MLDQEIYPVDLRDQVIGESERFELKSGSDESESDWPDGSDCGEAENEDDGQTVGVNDFMECSNELQ